MCVTCALLLMGSATGALGRCAGESVLLDTGTRLCVVEWLRWASLTREGLSSEVDKLVSDSIVFLEKKSWN